MRIAAAALSLAIFLSPGLALAADAEGTITKIDEETMTITLSDGVTYKLPQDMNLSGISTDVDVVIAYLEKENGEKQITDMFLPE
ncbi:DUF1344 domain-containing protein [Nitratireductor luteus]|uniref:DUF1344 domain-containing protein n=1 Tax=Nitratireductor luteus TaxID=2976980 RepID=UPI00223F971A|nr:DUF1344 domain-containing protein [Nitratireductor luteus]